MSTRISSAAICTLALVSCGPESPPPVGEALDCSIAGAQMAGVCTLEITTGSTGTIAVIHHPDGGFRRVNYARGDAFLQPVDGVARTRIVKQDAKGIAFAIENDAYFLPTRLMGDDARE